MDEIGTEVEFCLGIPEGVIGGISRNRMGALGRSMAGYLGRKLGGYSLSSVAAFWGRDAVTLCQGIAKVEKRIREDEKFARDGGKK